MQGAAPDAAQPLAIEPGGDGQRLGIGFDDGVERRPFAVGRLDPIEKAGRQGPRAEPAGLDVGLVLSDRPLLELWKRDRPGWAGILVLR